MPKATATHSTNARAAADAELIAATAAYPAAIRAIRALNRGGDCTDEEMQALLDQENGALDAVAELGARTVRGLVAKAKLLLLADRNAIARYEEVGEMEQAISRSLARDVVRLLSAGRQPAA